MFTQCLSTNVGIVNPYIQTGVGSASACWAVCSTAPRAPFTYASWKASGQLECKCFNQFTDKETDCGSGDTYVWGLGNSGPSPNVRRRRLAAEHQAALVAEQNPYCPVGLSACRLNRLSSHVGFECINPQTEVESRGGCVYGTIQDANDATGVE